jgi:hypothetical protein
MKRPRYTRGISFSLTQDQYEKIKTITDEQELSIAEWFRAVVDEVLQSDSKTQGSNYREANPTSQGEKVQVHGARVNEAVQERIREL